MQPNPLKLILSFQADHLFIGFASSVLQGLNSVHKQLDSKKIMPLAYKLYPWKRRNSVKISI